MNAQVTVPLPARRQGRRGRARGADVAPRGAGMAPAPTPDRIPRVARVLALAHHWQGLIRSCAVRDQADLARLIGISRARVTQVIQLAYLSPEIQESILTSRQPCAGDTEFTEAALRALAIQWRWSLQRDNWSQLLGSRHQPRV